MLVAEKLPTSLPSDKRVDPVRGFTSTTFSKKVVLSEVRIPAQGLAGIVVRLCAGSNTFFWKKHTDAI